MSQSLAQNYLHIIFSTKNREPLIMPPYEDELHSYLATTCQNLESPALKIGGYTDHVHILCMLSKKITLMKFMGEIKSNSSKWMKTNDAYLKNFFWQDGYGAFSVSPWDIDTIKAYIANQHAHHGNKTFQDEYRAVLKQYRVEYDERYVWD